MNFIYVNNYKLDTNNIYHKDIIKTIPTIKFINAVSNKLYTIIMIDIDAPTKNNNIYSPFLHLIVCNIKGNDLISTKLNKNIIVSYYPPSPPLKNDIHRYKFIIYEQKNFINITDNYNRPIFDINSFIIKYNLKFVSEEIIKIIN